jgi:pyruvate kinase
LQGLIHFDEILREADGIIVSRGNLGLDLPPEKVVLKPEHGINIMLLVNGL